MKLSSSSITVEAITQVNSEPLVRSCRELLERLSAYPLHIDMRSDWNTRSLERGSPAGGDLATWWTARSTLGNILTPKIRVDDRRRFNWKVNRVSIQPISLTRRPEDGLVLKVGLLAYSPFFCFFEVSVNGTAWREEPDAEFSMLVRPGGNSIRARVVTENGWVGPVYEVRFECE